MQLFLGDHVTLVKNETFVMGQVSGICLDKQKELERIYLHEIDMAFWMSDGWKIGEEEEAIDDDNEFED